MKSENNNLEKNISRLIKLTDDSDKPNKTFTESLINGAIDELSKKTSSTTRERKSTIMTAKKIFAYAAGILVVCGVLIAVMMSKSQSFKQQARDMTTSTMNKQYEDKSKSEPRPAKVEYTVGASQSGPSAVGTPAPAGPAQTQEKMNVLVVARENEKGISGTSYERKQLGAGDRLDIAAKPVGQEVSIKLRMMDDKNSATKGFGMEPPKEVGCIVQRMPVCPPRPQNMVCQQPMAHGGTTPPNGEAIDAMFFKNYGVNPFIDTEDDHLSTFATDVDTASYTVVRGYLHDGHLPPNDAVRVEEFVNYFKYDYPAPRNDDFAVYAEAAPWQFGTNRQNSFLLRLALKGRQISDENRKPAILTFVIDVSGSMGCEDRLGLVKKSLRLLIDRLRPEDKIGIAVYDSRGRKLMDYKGLDEKDEILAAIEMLGPGGSTYAEEGIRIGYEMAEKAFQKGYINRVILCTDGVANVGQTGADDILKVIREKAGKGITLSAIGFGMGNYNDILLEQLGDRGNGHYAYIDTIAEAKRIFEENLTGTLEVIARDVKVQVDFNPDVVRSYRLIGYENRDVPDDKFRNDKYDGGEVGSGHSVTALYELKLWPGKKGRISTTYVRYKNAETDTITEFKSVFDSGKINRGFNDSSKQFRLAATVTEFAEILRHSYWAKGATLEPVLQKAQTLAPEFKGNTDVIELVDLISKAERLMPKPPVEPVEETIGE